MRQQCHGTHCVLERPGQEIKLDVVYPMSTGAETLKKFLRVLDSISSYGYPQGRNSVWELEDREDVIHLAAVYGRGKPNEIPDGWKAPKALPSDRPHSEK